MKKLIIWLIDYFYMLIGAVSMVIFQKTPKHHLGHIVKEKFPIVVIPGLLGRWSFMRPIVNTLSFAGHPIFVVPRLENNLLEIPLSAKIVQDVIEEHKIKGAVIVAHSKGGLIGKYFLNHYNKNGNILGMVSLATPYSGSAMAKLVAHDAFLELLPDSLIINELKKYKRINNRIISIIPSYDNHVWHDDGSFLEGAMENIKVAVSGHHKIIFDKKVSEIVLKSVEKFHIHKE